MSGAPSLHPRIEAAAHGQLPEWAEVAPQRRTHLRSVARLMEGWARGLELSERDRKRWIAAAWLHDALRSADPESLREARDVPAKLRHGPATAARLRAEGVDDDDVLEAIEYHTLGRPGMSRLGRYLFLADYLDPEREVEDDELRARLRSQLPHDLDGTLVEVVERRLSHQIQLRHALHPETVGFWNEVVQRHE